MEQNFSFPDTPVAWIIFAITIAISLFAFYNDDLYNKLILQPYNVSKGKYVYTLITSGFIHADWMHLLFNMMTFYFFAFDLERALGHWQFALLYMISLILSDLPSVAKHKNDFWYRSLGASGAISAVVFSAILFNPLGKMGLLFIPIQIPAVLFGILYLIYCSYASKKGIGNINHDAHFFGALSGIMITVLLRPGIVSDFFHAITGGVQSLLH
ncbi:MAG TPA: rhomboid family intramembrane serine protease [Mucilaginibacter sp.]|jgi:membrane associated rhomboid family serine protease|nr:rhomboid family intramembrane serine protease [Mucilaginibacter sp.]